MRKGYYICLVVIFIVSCKENKNSEIKREIQKVGIVPLGDFQSSHIDSIRKAIFDVYGFTSYTLSSQKMPQEFYTAKKSPRYDASKIIDFVHKNQIDSLDLTLGVTSYDVCATKYLKDGSIKKPEYKYTDWGVFGLGYLGKSGCVVSSFRLKKFKKNK